jgi:histidine kinase
VTIDARFWLVRVGWGLLLGSAIAALEFASYYPRSSAPYEIGLHSFALLLLVWCPEGVLLALTLGLVERAAGPRELRVWQLALAVAAGAIGGVLIWSLFTQLLLREQLGIALFIDHVGQPAVWTGQVLYHSWMMFFFGGLAVSVYASQRRRARMLAALSAAQLGRATSQRRLAEATLASLQARIDPDYLFRTLTRMERLYETDAAAADRLLDELVAFLRDRLCKEGQ